MLKKKIRVAGCFMEYEGQFLVLRRSSSQNQTGKWGIPAGRIDGDETEAAAAAREVSEETGLPADPAAMDFLNKTVIEFPDKINEFSAFRLVLQESPAVRLTHEHDAYQWVRKGDCCRLDLIAGAHQVFAAAGYCHD